MFGFLDVHACLVVLGHAGGWGACPSRYAVALFRMRADFLWHLPILLVCLLWGVTKLLAGTVCIVPCLLCTDAFTVRN